MKIAIFDGNWSEGSSIEVQKRKLPFLTEIGLKGLIEVQK